MAPKARKAEFLNASKFKWFYLILGLILVVLPLLRPETWRGSDEDFTTFPIGFGLTFLAFFFVLGKSRAAAKMGFLASVVIIILMILRLAYLHNAFSEILGVLAFASLIGFTFLYTWVPYIFALYLLSKQGKS